MTPQRGRRDPRDPGCCKPAADHNAARSLTTKKSKDLWTIGSEQENTGHKHRKIPNQQKQNPGTTFLFCFFNDFSLFFPFCLFPALTGETPFRFPLPRLPVELGQQAEDESPSGGLPGSCPFFVWCCFSDVFCWCLILILM